MKYKKPLIFILALSVIAIALYGIWNWQKEAVNQPIRQEDVIR